MKISIDIPEDIGNSLQTQWGDLSRRALESLAVEGYRNGVLTRGQVRELLNFTSFYEVEKFLKEKGADLLYDAIDLEQDIQTAHKLTDHCLYISCETAG
ncbi:UPF0175 family protein [Pannus brasiliensis CCIBt3594]|uniref:UPF0175 family protein n=2 Tax=Bacillati TaxID=1783272 RepID=A0AAW9QY06_9CHRO|nr:UPF0175 family protein [Arcanobacterium phocae]